jgi:hypothetical protein
VPQLGTIKKILFQLITSKIIDIQYDTKEDDVLLGLGRADEDSTEMAMNKDSFWNDINTSD